MAKSMRSKKEKRLRAIRREMVKVGPLYEQKEVAKLAAQDAALAAPKLPVRHHTTTAAAAAAMELIASATSTAALTHTNSNMDVEMADKGMSSLKPVGKIGKKLRKKFKMGKGKRGGKGKISKRKI